MKSIQEIAASTSSTPFNHKTAPGKAQIVILDALGLVAESFGHAQAIFEAIGIQVVPTRQGRRSVPQVHLTEKGDWGLMPGGDYDGDVWQPSEGLDLSAIQEWMEVNNA